jgi:HJR/Mrr/RecB family endonuclease
MLRERITETYNEIIATMQERRLIQAIAEIQPKELRSVVKYKGKIISHPAGSEKSFFSLAILTALAHYFQTPVLIDEVANNLDTKNLKAFFELADEFKDRYGIQYVLSIKQTNDFELDGWVKELSNELAIHEIRDKQIRKLEI